MNLDYIRDNWVIVQGNIEYEIAAWDSVAEDFLYKENKDYDKDSFVRFVTDKVSLTKDMSMLDVGCGSGAYSVYFAGKVGRVDGVDLSPRMVEMGNAYASDHGIDNMKLMVEDWHNCPDDKYKGKYDLVFAHTTPAIMDYSTLVKMSNASTGHCFLSKHSHRSSTVYDRLCEVAEVSRRGGSDDDIAYAFDTLWGLGYTPEVAYVKREWNKERTLSDACNWYLSRLKGIGNIDEAAEKRVQNELEKMAVDGLITESMKTTMVNMYWTV